MVDLQGKDKGNISLPPALQTPDLTNATETEIDEQPVIINMQKAMYKTLITELEQKIERLKQRNETLEDFVEYVKNYSANQGIQSEALHVELNTDIAYQTKKVEELKKRYEESEAMRQDRIDEHEKKVKQINQSFEETRRQLSSEIKMLNAKINVLEEFKAAEEALVAKLNGVNAYMAQKEEELQETLEDFEFKTRVHRDNLKKETFKSVLDASKTFQSDLLETIPLTIQRLLRENIILENELVQCWSDHASITEDKENYKKEFKEFHKRIKEARSQTRSRLNTSKLQGLLVKKLKTAHSMVEKKLSKSYDTPENFEEDYQQIFATIEEPKFTDDDYNRRRLEVLLHQERIKLALTNGFKSKTAFAIDACWDALGMIKFAVNIAVSGEGEIVDVESFAAYLLNVIEDCNSRKWIGPTDSLESVELPSSVYPKGDLGFEPPHIEFEDLYEKIRSPSVMSTLEILQELQKLQEKIEPKEKRVSDARREGSVSSESTSLETDTTRSTVELVRDKQKEEKIKEDKLESFYEDMFRDIDEFEYEMEHDYDYFTDYDQE